MSYIQHNVVVISALQAKSRKVFDGIIYADANAITHDLYNKLSDFYHIWTFRNEQSIQVADLSKLSIKPDERHALVKL